MTSMISAIQNNYAHNFPTKVPQKAAQGFIATTAICLLAGSTVHVALAGGAIAVTATIIEAVTRPIIKAIFPKNPWFATCIQIGTATMVAGGLSHSISPWIDVAHQVAHQASSFLLSMVAWATLNDNFYEKNVGMAAIF